MNDTIEPLYALADEAGLQRHWRDADGRDHVVADETLVTILAALGHKAGTARQIAASRKALQQERERLPAMVVADAGQPIALPGPCQKAELTGEDGTIKPLEWRDGIAHGDYVVQRFAMIENSGRETNCIGFNRNTAAPNGRPRSRLYGYVCNVGRGQLEDGSVIAFIDAIDD